MKSMLGWLTLILKHASGVRSQQRTMKSMLGWLTLILLFILSLSCGGAQEEEVTEGEQAPTPQPEQVYQPTGNEGTITGKVNFQGQPPKFKALDMSADPVCADKHAEPVYPEIVVVNANNTLRNVFVYVKSGLGDKAFAVPTEPVVLDQNGCQYKPHVLGIQTRQNLKVITSDATTHNIHPIPKNNREWNVNQAPGADPIIRSFPRQEVMIPVKCNQHPWMQAWIGVLPHPFYAVSGEDGTFEIKGLPPGEYEIEAWQEKYGAITQKVTIGPKELKSIEFTYNAEQAYRPGSLQIMPALWLPCCGSEPTARLREPRTRRM